MTLKQKVVMTAETQSKMTTTITTIKITVTLLISSIPRLLLPKQITISIH